MSANHETTPSMIDWALLEKLSAEGNIPLKPLTLKAIRRGKRRWTDDNAIEVHRATNGAVPCWLLRPDHYHSNQLPPCLSLDPAV